MPAQEIHSEWAKTLAEQLVASGDAPPTGLTDDERLALAWALKRITVTAWSSDPAFVARAASTLVDLSPSNEDVPTTSALTEIRAVAHWGRGIAALATGRMSDAVGYLDNAAALFERGGDRNNAAQTQVSKIMALSVLGLHEQAADCGDKARREFLTMGDLLAAGKVSLNLGNLCAHREANEAALLHYREASTLLARVQDHERGIMADIGSANAYTSLGCLDEAEQFFSRAEQQSREMGFPVLESLAIGTVSLLHLARGQYRIALAHLEHSRQRFETLGIPQHLAAVEKMLGDVYLELRLLPEALALLDRVIDHFENLEMPVDQAWALAQKGRTFAALERPVDEINAVLVHAAALFKSQGIDAGEATVLLGRAEVALSGNNPNLAHDLARDSANIFARVGMVTGNAQAEALRARALLASENIVEAAALFKSTLDRARELQLLSIQVRCQIGLGLVLVKRGETRAAKLAFESAIELFEEQRDALAGDDLRHAFLVDHLHPYEELLRIALRSYDDSLSELRASEVLIRLEQFRARALGERLGDSRERDSAADADGVERDLRARLNWLHRRAEKLLNDGESNQALLDDARQIEFELLERARRRRLTAAASGSSSERAELSSRELHAALARGDALVEYGVLDDELFACVVARNGVALKRNVAQWTEVVEAIHTARFQIETLRNGAGELNKHLDLLERRSQTALRRLHALIWAPLADLLVDCHRVLIVPHEQLGSVPFAALHDRGHYLSLPYEIAVAPSARVALRGLGRHPVPPRHAVVVGESSRLLHAAEEAQFVASLFDAATVLTGQDANGDALRAASVQADVLHLACHGQFRSDNPMFSALHLVDGPFTVQDVEALRLPQGIVVLSACESGVATASKGDEVIGLVRAFLIAGAARVVASLWPVDDAVTTEFMAAFYSSLRAGAAPAAALRSAQLEVMKTHPHPFHWAAFAVYGGW